VFLQDVPGFMVGSKVEHAGIIRHGAKMLHAMSAATVPKLTVVVRKAYGAGYYVMCGRAYEPDLIVAWPTGGDQRDGRRGHGGHRRARKLFGGEPPPPEMKQQIVDQIQGYIDIYKVGGLGPRRRRHRPAGHAPRARLGPRARRHKQLERPREEARALSVRDREPPLLVRAWPRL
jgi:hypothetical protein